MPIKIPVVIGWRSVMAALMRVISVGVTVATAASGCSADEPSAVPAEANVERLFTHVGDFALGPATDRLDYQTVDAARRRLYIAKMGAGQLLVFDVDRNTLVAALDGFPKVTGVLAVPELGKLYASVPGSGLASSLSVGLGMIGLSSGRGEIAVVDLGTLRETARLSGGVFPDGLAYDPKHRRIFVSDEFGSAVLVIDANTDRQVGRVELGGEAGNVRYDPVTERIYVPIQSRNELAVIDSAGLRIIARHPLVGGRHPHGLMIAPESAVGYIACDGDDRLLTIELRTGRVVANDPVAHDPDVLAIDVKARRLYVASESGLLSVFDISSATAPRSLGEVFAGPGAHTVAVDPMTHRVYVALADLNGRSVLRVLAPRD